MHTDELILQTAVRLFNQEGTANVTTNHVAKEAGISPGNLYYYFKDKAHIIREIYEQMIRDWERAYDLVEGESSPASALPRFIEVNFELLWQYRFFYRETVALMNADAALAMRHTAVSQARFARQRELLQKAQQAGLLAFRDPAAQLDQVLTVVWIVANHYLIYLEAMGHAVEKADFKQGAALVMSVLEPYLKL